MTKSINKKEIALDIAVFLLSCLSGIFIYVFLLYAFLKLREGSMGYIKMNMLFVIRQVFYVPGLPIMSGGQSTVKLLLIAVASVWVLLNYLMKHEYRVPGYVVKAVLFAFFAFFSASVFGSYPITGMIKVVSFALVLITTILAIKDSVGTADIEGYVYYYLSSVLLVSLFLTPFGIGYTQGSAGMLFRGIWNHPNDFGIACAIYLSMAFVRNEKKTWQLLVNILCVFVMIFLSRSRGAMLAALGVMVMYFIYCKNRKERDIMIVAGIVVALTIVLTPFGKSVAEFFIKNSGESVVSTDVFTTRDEIWEAAKVRFESNPLFGRGLLISYEPGEVSYSFEEKMFEPGNIFFELLGGTGLVGVLMFVLMILSFFNLAKGKRKIFVLMAVLASMSEVSFFSVNNYAFLYYVVIALGAFPFAACAKDGDEACVQHGHVTNSLRQISIVKDQIGQ